MSDSSLEMLTGFWLQIIVNLELDVLAEYAALQWMQESGLFEHIYHGVVEVETIV